MSASSTHCCAGAAHAMTTTPFARSCPIACSKQCFAVTTSSPARGSSSTTISAPEKPPAPGDSRTLAAGESAAPPDLCEIAQRLLAQAASAHASIAAWYRSASKSSDARPMTMLARIVPRTSQGTPERDALEQWSEGVRGPSTPPDQGGVATICGRDGGSSPIRNRTRLLLPPPVGPTSKFSPGRVCSVAAPRSSSCVKPERASSGSLPALTRGVGNSSAKRNSLGARGLPMPMRAVRCTWATLAPASVQTFGKPARERESERERERERDTERERQRERHTQRERRCRVPLP